MYCNEHHTQSIVCCVNSFSIIFMRSIISKNQKNKSVKIIQWDRWNTTIWEILIIIILKSYEII